MAVDKWIERAKKCKINRNCPVVIYGHKETQFLVAIVGCLFIGAPFVPVDTIYPKERLKRIIEITRTAFVYQTASDEFIETGIELTELEEKQLAYIIFTSGSTGEPKGVQIGLESVRELVSWMKTCFSLGQKPVYMNQAPFSFDLSMYEVLGFLSMGGTCVLMPRHIVADQNKFFQRLNQNKVTVWVSTPSFAHQQLLNKTFDEAHFSTLKTFLFCGEPFSNALAKKLLQRFPSVRLLNTYGPTEATVATTLMVIDEKAVNLHDVLPVGYAKPGSKIITDQETGELCIFGKHVMRGYLNNAELNRQKMVMRDGFRGFRTGDVGVIDKNGLIFCKGRLDEQIKFNGYRIEITEIDQELQALPGIANAACAPLKRVDGSVARLIGFVVRDDQTINMGRHEWLIQIEHWKNALSKRIPVYMIPSELVEVDSLPMSSNNKVDRRQLINSYGK